MDKLEKKVDLLDSIVTELEYDFTTLFSEDPDNLRLKEIKAKFNMCIRNIDLYGDDVKGKSLVIYDDESGKDKDCVRNLDLCVDDVENNGNIYNDLQNYDLVEESENDDSIGLENKNLDVWNYDIVDDDDQYDDGFRLYEKGQCSHATDGDCGNDDEDGRNNFYENYETGQCSHLTKESDNEILKDVNYDKEKNDKKGFKVFEVPEVETVAKVKEGISCVQLLEEEMHKVLEKSELQYENKITFCEDGFKNFGIPEIFKEAEQKIPFSPYSIGKNDTFDKDLDAKMLNKDEFEDEKRVKALASFASPVVVSKKVTFDKDVDAKMLNKDEFEDEKRVKALASFASPVVVSKKVTFDKDVDAKMLNKDEFEDEKKVKALASFTSPVVVSKKVTIDKDVDAKMSNENEFVDGKKVKHLPCFSSPFVVSSSFPQHSLFEGPSFSLGPEFEIDPETEDEKPVIKDILIRQNPRRDVGIAAHSKSPYKVRQILPNVPLKQSEERVADTLFMMPEDTNQM